MVPTIVWTWPRGPYWACNIGILAALLAAQIGWAMFIRPHCPTWLQALVVVSTCTVLGSYIFTAFVNPGICTGPHRMPIAAMKQASQPSPQPNVVSTRHAIRGPGWHWCHTCRQEVPDSAWHCPEMLGCVEGYHHFCIMVNNAIGAMNSRAFHALTISAAIAIGSVMAGIPLMGTELATRK